VIRDPESHWRKFAPAGYEDLFAVTRAKYTGEKISVTFGDQVVESIENSQRWEHWIDLQVIRVLRMRRARWISEIIKANKFLSSRTAVDEIMQGREGRCRQGGVGQWGHIGPLQTPEKFL
jgi:hypothetical protein